MPLTTKDRQAINELIALHGHLADSGELHRLDELFSAEAVYDLRDFGQGELRGLDAIREAGLALGERNQLDHHVKNVGFWNEERQEVRHRTKGVAIEPDGASGCVVYEDAVPHINSEWRIVYRKVSARRVPLTP